MARQMKDSGIEWIGDIPAHWQVIPHKYVMHKEKSICEHYNGEDIISLTMNGVIVRDLTAGGKMPTTFDGYQYVEPEDLLMCLFDIDVTPRCVGIVRNHGVTSPAYSRFKVHEGYYNAYYDYLLRFIDDEKVFIHLAKNLRSSLTETDFGAIKTIVPPLEEQKRIAEYLDHQCTEIDAVIAKTKATIEEYKKLKQSIITNAVTKGIRGNDRPMKDSGIEWIGDIPAEWEIRKLFRAIDKIGDIDHYMPNSVETGIPYLMTGDLKEKISQVDFDVCKQVSLEDYETLSSKIKATKGDIIFARYATIGTVCIVDIDKDFLVSYSCLTIKPTQSLLIGNFLFYYLKSTAFFEDVKQYINSNTQANVGLDSMTKAKIVLPTLQEQEEIADFLDRKCAEIDKLIADKTHLLEEMESYKKSVIYEYVTGKKEVE